MLHVGCGTYQRIFFAKWYQDQHVTDEGELTIINMLATNPHYIPPLTRQY